MRQWPLSCREQQRHGEAVVVWFAMAMGGGAEGAECVYVRGDDVGRGLSMFVLRGNGHCRVESDNVGVGSQSKEGRNFVHGLEDGATVVL